MHCIIGNISFHFTNIWYFNPGWYNARKEGLKCLTEEYDGDHDRNCEYGLHIKSVP